MDCPACATLAMPQTTKALFAITPKKAFFSFCACAFLFHNAFAVELSTICPSGSTNCHINATYQGQSVTNNQYVSFSTDIHLDTPLTHFINNSIIRLSNTSIRARTANQGSLENFINNGRIESTTDYTNTIIFEGGRALNNVINYGYIAGAIAVSDDWSLTITNHGTMGGVFNQSTNGTNITINNRGVINQTIGRYHFSGIVTIINYAMLINKNADEFNAFIGNNAQMNAKNNSHIIFSPTSRVSFANADSKLILDFGREFEIGKGYALDKLLVKTDGTSVAVGEDLFSRLTTKNDAYELSREGNFFLIKAEPKNSTISQVNKANSSTMSNITSQSNTLLNKQEFSSSKGQGAQKGTLKGQRGGKGTQTRNKKGKKARGKEQYYGDEYYIAIMPFGGYNTFAESGRYNLSGFDAGLLGVVGKRLDSASSAGVQFGVSYLNLNDKDDKEFKINSMNIMVGANYKRDLKRGYFVKTRGDFFYLMNEVSSASLDETQKPNNMGFGVSLAGGKEFKLNKKDKVSLALGLDYKGLKTAETTTAGAVYEAGLYHFVNLDLGANYDTNVRTGFGMLGLNAGAGVRGNVSGDSLAKSQVVLNGTSVDMLMDYDKVVGYVNLGVGYEFMVLKKHSEISLMYNGSFGDKSMSNGGGAEFKMRW